VSNPAIPLKRYGVLRAAVVDRRIETTDTPHHQIHLRAAGTDYRAAVNMRSQRSPPDLLYLGVDRFEHPILKQVRRLPDGFTEIESRSGGAAIDYIRGNLFDRKQMRPVPTAAPGPENNLGDFLDHFVRRALGDLDARAYLRRGVGAGGQARQGLRVPGPATASTTCTGTRATTGGSPATTAGGPGRGPAAAGRAAGGGRGRPGGRPGAGATRQRRRNAHVAGCPRAQGRRGGMDRRAGPARGLDRGVLEIVRGHASPAPRRSSCVGGGAGFRQAPPRPR
jgi:hypothetical protein